jgi:hypothetical protein
MCIELFLDFLDISFSKIIAENEILWIEHNFLSSPRIPPLEIHTVIYSHFSPSPLIGQERVRIKARAVNWNQSKLVVPVKINPRFFNSYITRGACVLIFPT